MEEGVAARAAAWSRLIEAVLHIASVGTLVGLLRLVGMLRPGTLLLVRGSEGPIGLPLAATIAVSAALLHAGALLLAWATLGRTISRVRNDRRDDHFDSLLQTARIFLPGYLAAPALLVVAAGLGWSQRRWLPVVVIVWTLLAIAGVLGGRRFARLLDRVRVLGARRGLRVVRIAGPALVVAGAGLAVAGFMAQLLLRLL